MRICAIGNSGSGKSTLARTLASALALPAIELDAIFHQPGWTQLEPAEFRRRVAAALDAAVAEYDGWVADGNYSRHVSDLTVGAADAVVWFDFPRARVMWQLSKRTFARVSTKQELWNGNTEKWSNLLRWDPEKNILRWAWTQHAHYRRKCAEMTEQSAARVFRVRTPAQRDAALAELVGLYARAQ